MCFSIYSACMWQTWSKDLVTSRQWNKWVEKQYLPSQGLWSSARSKEINYFQLFLKDNLAHGWENPMCNHWPRETASGSPPSFHTASILWNTSSLSLQLHGHSRTKSATTAASAAQLFPQWPSLPPTMKGQRQFYSHCWTRGSCISRFPS